MATGGFGMLPPNLVESVTVKNVDASPVMVTALYKQANGELKETTAVIPAGQAVKFPPKTENMGTWEALTPIVKVQVCGQQSNEMKILEAPFGTSGVVKDVELKVSTHDNGMLNVAAV
eukprot:comp11507_c0_seq1/m.5955 comp11507_c0_seq1/g.5955  ORF comp11507_c0_seq1/g.5955 comp11507_c0_seq1/m.5955 type:complete len:118 (-) comp11507_c0_seq1:480-833(-)